MDDSSCSAQKRRIVLCTFLRVHCRMRKSPRPILCFGLGQVFLCPTLSRRQMAQWSCDLFEVCNCQGVTTGPPRTGNRGTGSGSKVNFIFFFSKLISTTYHAWLCDCLMLGKSIQNIFSQMVVGLMAIYHRWTSVKKSPTQQIQACKRSLAWSVPIPNTPTFPQTSNWRLVLLLTR